MGRCVCLFGGSIVDTEKKYKIGTQNWYLKNKLKTQPALFQKAKRDTELRQDMYKMVKRVETSEIPVALVPVACGKDVLSYSVVASNGRLALVPVAKQSNSASGKLSITIDNATGLVAKDKHRTRDPYVRVKVGQQPSLRTSSATKTLNPIWNEIFVFNVQSADELVLVEVWDQDVWSGDDFMGEAELGTVQKLLHDHNAALANGLSLQLQLKPRTGGKLDVRGDTVLAQPPNAGQPIKHTIDEAHRQMDVAVNHLKDAFKTVAPTFIPPVTPSPIPTPVPTPMMLNLHVRLTHEHGQESFWAYLSDHIEDERCVHVRTHVRACLCVRRRLCAHMCVRMHACLCVRVPIRARIH